MSERFLFFPLKVCVFGTRKKFPFYDESYMFWGWGLDLFITKPVQENNNNNSYSNNNNNKKKAKETIVDMVVVGVGYVRQKGTGKYEK